MQHVPLEEAVEQIVARDPRFHRDAYLFVREALDHTQKNLRKTHKTTVRHITGQQLLAGIRDYALQQFGPMTLAVLQEWGVRSCEDVGEVVFNMVETNLLAKSERDSRDDFRQGYDFQEAFLHPFVPSQKRSALVPETKATQG